MSALSMWKFTSRRVVNSMFGRKKELQLLFKHNCGGCRTTTTYKLCAQWSGSSNDGYKIDNIVTVSTLSSRLLPPRQLNTTTISSSRSSSSGQAFYKSRPEEKVCDNDDGIPSGGWLLLVIPVSALMLGIWQVFRWRWKLGLIEEMRLKTASDPVPLPLSVDEIEELEYSKVKVRGEFDYTNEVLMGPRSLVPLKEGREKDRGVFSSASQQHGFHVITPFKVEGSNEVILVNRGWIKSKDPKKFKHLTGPIDIVGVVRKNEPRAPFVTKNKPGQTILHYRDVPLMSAKLGAEEIFLDLYSIDGVNFANEPMDSVPVPRQTRVTLRNEHVSYFVTWFSLSVITGLMWHRRFIKRLDLL